MDGNIIVYSKFDYSMYSLGVPVEPMIINAYTFFVMVKY